MVVVALAAAAAFVDAFRWEEDGAAPPDEEVAADAADPMLASWPIITS